MRLKPYPLQTERQWKVQHGTEERAPSETTTVLELVILIIWPIQQRVYILPTQYVRSHKCRSLFLHFNQHGVGRTPCERTEKGGFETRRAERCAAVPVASEGAKKETVALHKMYLMKQETSRRREGDEGKGSGGGIQSSLH